jgi:hypothetical protein
MDGLGNRRVTASYCLHALLLLLPASLRLGRHPPAGASGDGCYLKQCKEERSDVIRLTYAVPGCTRERSDEASSQFLEIRLQADKFNISRLERAR